MDFLIAGINIQYNFYGDSNPLLSEDTQIEPYQDNRIWRVTASQLTDVRDREQIWITPIETIPAVGGIPIWETDICTIYKSGDAIFRVYHDGVIKKPYAVCLEDVCGKRKVICDSSWLQRYVHTNYVFNVCALEEIMTKYGRLVFHCCFVQYRAEAILFSGFSGIGKSTQGALWEKYRNAEVINGDRCVLTKENGIWFACGFPFSGTSGICKNKKLPIKMIVFLKQSPDNEIRVIDRLHAGRMLWQQMMVNQWNTAFIDTVLAGINQMVVDIPIYELKCTPDEAAVKCLEQILENKKEQRAVWIL